MASRPPQTWGGSPWSFQRNGVFPGMTDVNNFHVPGVSPMVMGPAKTAINALGMPPTVPPNPANLFPHQTMTQHGLYDSLIPPQIFNNIVHATLEQDIPHFRILRPTLAGPDRMSGLSAGVLRFGHQLPTVVPEGSTVRQLSHTYESFFLKHERYGQGFRISADAARTPAGAALIMEYFKCLSSNMTVLARTIATSALLNCKNPHREYINSLMEQGMMANDTRSLNTVFRSIGQLHRGERTIFQIINDVKRGAAKSNASPYTLCLCSSTAMDLIAYGDEKMTEVYRVGPEANAIMKEGGDYYRRHGVRGIKFYEEKEYYFNRQGAEGATPMNMLARDVTVSRHWLWTFKEMLPPKSRKDIRFMESSLFGYINMDEEQGRIDTHNYHDLINACACFSHTDGGNLNRRIYDQLTSDNAKQIGLLCDKLHIRYKREQGSHLDPFLVHLPASSVGANNPYLITHLGDQDTYYVSLENQATNVEMALDVLKENTCVDDVCYINNSLSFLTRNGGYHDNSQFGDYVVAMYIAMAIAAHVTSNIGGKECAPLPHVIKAESHGNSKMVLSWDGTKSGVLIKVNYKGGHIITTAGNSFLLGGVTVIENTTVDPKTALAHPIGWAGSAAGVTPLSAGGKGPVKNAKVTIGATVNDLEFDDYCNYVATAYGVSPIKGYIPGFSTIAALHYLGSLAGSSNGWEHVVGEEVFKEMHTASKALNSIFDTLLDIYDHPSARNFYAERYAASKTNGTLVAIQQNLLLRANPGMTAKGVDGKSYFLTGFSFLEKLPANYSAVVTASVPFNLIDGKPVCSTTAGSMWKQAGATTPIAAADRFTGSEEPNPAINDLAYVHPQSASSNVLGLPRNNYSDFTSDQVSLAKRDAGPLTGQDTGLINEQMRIGDGTIASYHRSLRPNNPHFNIFWERRRNQFGGYPVSGNPTNALRYLCNTFYCGTKIHKETFKNMASKNVAPPLSFFIVDPFITIRTSALIFASESAETGIMSYFLPDVSEAYDADHKFVDWSLTFNMGAMVTRPENIFIYPDAVFERYLGGGDGSFIYNGMGDEYDSAQNMRNVLLSRANHKIGYNPHSESRTGNRIVTAVGAAFEPRNLPKFVPLAGPVNNKAMKLNPWIPQSVMAKDNDTDFPMAVQSGLFLLQKFQFHLSLRSAPTMPNDAPYTRESRLTSMINFISAQGDQYAYNPATTRVNIQIRKGQGPLGSIPVGGIDALNGGATTTERIAKTHLQSGSTPGF